MSNENDVSAGLAWYAFSSRYLPGQRRHDLEALKTYEAYRSAVIAASSGPRRAPKAADPIRRRPARHSRSPGESTIQADRVVREARAATLELVSLSRSNEEGPMAVERSHALEQRRGKRARIAAWIEREPSQRLSPEQRRARARSLGSGAQAVGGTAEKR
jgi:hypothetical protein